MSALTPTFDGLPLAAELSFPEVTYGHGQLPVTPMDAAYLEPDGLGGATDREIASVFWYWGYRPDGWRSDAFTESVSTAPRHRSRADAHPLDLAR